MPGKVIRKKPKPTTTTTTTLAPKPTPSKLGSVGVWSIDQWDRELSDASDRVYRKRGVRVSPRFLKAVLYVETGGNGAYPLTECRPCDGHDCVPACGPFQIKWPFHQQRCPECKKGTPSGEAEMAAHILGMTMLERKTDEYGALLAVYFPTDDVNGTTQKSYVKKVKQLIATMEADATGTTPATTPAPVVTTTTPAPKPDPWRPYPYPAMVRLIVQKPAEGAGFDRVASRKNRIRGFSTHITDGSGSIEWLASFFSTGGERAWDALTDTCIGRDGRIGLLNDWRDDKNGGTRAGWANGGVDGLEGDGTAFYRAFPDINSCLVSCEHVARSGEAWTDAMLESTIELRTAIAQELKCPWDAYPYHPAYGGVSIEQQHRNFATKSCPANPYINQYDAVVKREVKAKLKAWQGGQTSGPAPTPEPVWYTRFGFSLDDIETFFGTITRHNQDGTTDELGFNPEGALSLLWLNRCDKEGKFPEAERIWYSDAQFVEGQEMWASWVGGWTSFLPLVDSRASWQWLDSAKP